MFDINIAHKKIGKGHKPFVIAELSGNHNQNLDTAIAMVEAAAKAGVDAVKLQTYTADSMTLDVQSDDFVIQEKDSLWFGQSLHALYQKAATPYEWHSILFSKAKALGLVAFSSPFDEDAVAFLETLDAPCYKIASFELTDLPLIKAAAQTQKPLIMSTGMASLAEIEEAVNTAKQAGCKELILLKCTSTYPASARNTNLATIAHLQSAFGCQVGLSDHTRGIGVAVASVALGATVIEKHFVLDRRDGGVDAEFSLEPNEFEQLVIESHVAHEALGKVHYGGTTDEQKSKYYRRSIYVCRDIQQGERLTSDNLKIVRPANGLAPKHWETVLGKVAKKHLVKGTPLDWSLFD